MIYARGYLHANFYYGYHRKKLVLISQIFRSNDIPLQGFQFGMQALKSDRDDLFEVLTKSRMAVEGNQIASALGFGFASQNALDICIAQGPCTP